jgi:hypothetical protein
MSGDVTDQVIDLSTMPKGLFFSIETHLGLEITLYTTAITGAYNDELARGIAVTGLVAYAGDHMNTQVTCIIEDGSEFNVWYKEKYLNCYGRITSIIQGNC